MTLVSCSQFEDIQWPIWELPWACIHAYTPAIFSCCAGQSYPDSWIAVAWGRASETRMNRAFETWCSQQRSGCQKAGRGKGAKKKHTLLLPQDPPVRGWTSYLENKAQLLIACLQNHNNSYMLCRTFNISGMGQCQVALFNRSPQYVKDQSLILSRDHGVFFSPESWSRKASLPMVHTIIPHFCQANRPSGRFY